VQVEREGSGSPEAIERRQRDAAEALRAVRDLTPWRGEGSQGWLGVSCPHSQPGAPSVGCGGVPSWALWTRPPAHTHLSSLLGVAGRMFPLSAASDVSGRHLQASPSVSPPRRRDSDSGRRRDRDSGRRRDRDSARSTGGGGGGGSPAAESPVRESTIGGWQESPPPPPPQARRRAGAGDEEKPKRRVRSGDAAAPRCAPPPSGFATLLEVGGLLLVCVRAASALCVPCQPSRQATTHLWGSVAHPVLLCCVAAPARPPRVHGLGASVEGVPELHMGGAGR
jgi:hypothetical protein